MKCLKAFAGILCCSLNYGAAGLTKDVVSDDGITMHLHRLTAKHEFDPTKFDHAAFSLSIWTLFDIAEKEQDLVKMAAIITFFKEEDIIPKDLSVLRGRLFQKLTASKLQYSRFRSAFKSK
jgi:hypothetical protein